VGIRHRIRSVTNGLLVITLLGLMPVSALAEALQTPCASMDHHQCDAPAIASCCCRDSGGGTTPADTPTTQGQLTAPLPVQLSPEVACGAELIVPPQAWFHAATRCAGPPLDLNILNVTILR
jgi:hypothetical protein